MKELPQVTIGEIKEDAEIDWRSAPDDDGDNDSDPTSAPRWLIQLLGFDPFQEEEARLAPTAPLVRGPDEPQ
jgi:hypothetical protein